MSDRSASGQSAQGNYIAQAKDRSTAKVDVRNITYADADVRPRPVDAEVLQEALRALEKLPLEEIPALAPRQHGSPLMLVDHNPLFVGREDDFKALAEALKAAEDGRAATVAVTGMGGLGKTQLVSEFVHRYGQYFLGGAFWLNFADGAAVPFQIASCGGSGGMELRADFRDLPPDDQVKEVMSAWQSSLPRLLVFDNCEEEKLLKQWRPPSTGGCRVVLTSRREVWDPYLGVKVVALDVLRREESVALLRRRCPDLPRDEPALDAIAKELGDLPLALELAGGYLARYRRVVSPSDCLAQLQSPELLQHPSLRQAKGGISPIERERDVARTLALSYERLDTEDPIDALAVALLTRATLFAAGEPIPHELLVKALELPEGDSEAPLRAEDALVRLAELGMLQEQEEGAHRMHRLVAAFVQSVGAEKEGPWAIEEAQRGVEEALADTVRPLIDEGYPAPLLELLPHLRVVTEAAKGREEERAALLCNHLGACFRMMGIYGESRPLLERALTIYENVLGEQHPDTAASLNNLASVLLHQGDYEGARPLLERALVISEKVHGAERPETAAVLNNLALVLKKQGAYARAKPLYERALAIREQVLGAEHPDTAVSLDNLATLLSEQGAYAGAKPLCERSLAIHEKVHGAEHPETAVVLSNLGSLLVRQGAYAEAKPHLQRSLAIRENVLGPEHPNTAKSLNNLGMLLVRQGAYAEAEPLYERALAIHEKVLGADHPDTALSFYNLGRLLVRQGAYGEARHYLERALAIFKKVLAEGHPTTELVRQSLTILDTQQR